MKKLLLFILISLLVSCSGWVKSPIEKLTEDEKLKVLSDGNLNGYLYSDTDRLNLMTPPVVIVSKGLVSHGVFREKYKTYNVIVKTGDGKFYTFYGTEWESLNAGDTVKNINK